MKLDLAAGTRCREGYEGVDLELLPGVVHKVDLSVYPWPWDDESVEALNCSHYVEHVDDLVAFMNECHRILVPGGVLDIRCPYQHSNEAWQDPTHVRALNEMSWVYYRQDWLEQAGFTHYGITADFEGDVELMIFDEAKALFRAHPDQPLEEVNIPDIAVKCWNNVVSEMRVHLVKQ